MDVKTIENGGTAKRFNQRKMRRNLFFAALVTLPVLQFCICYIYVNLNSFMLAFQSYTMGLDGWEITPTFDNFATAFTILTDSAGLARFGNSLQLFFWTTCVGLTLALLFSYYIYKKYPMSELFRVILFLPKIMSGVIFCLLYKYITNGVLNEVLTNWFGAEKIMGGLLGNQDWALPAVLFFSVWIGFGVNVLMFSGSMSGIDESIVESAQLDGANTVQEFIFITVPMIWPTFVSFLTINFAGIFTDQMHLYTFYGNDISVENLETFGYYLYVNSTQSDFKDVTLNSGAIVPSLPTLAAVGLCMTAVMLPATVTLRKCLRKFGPRVD